MWTGLLQISCYIDGYRHIAPGSVFARPPLPNLRQLNSRTISSVFESFRLVLVYRPARFQFAASPKINFASYLPCFFTSNEWPMQTPAFWNSVSTWFQFLSSFSVYGSPTIIIRHCARVNKTFKRCNEKSQSNTT